MTYRAPVDQIAAALDDVAGLPGLIESGLLPSLDGETVSAILEEAGKFATEQIAPLNHQGDTDGAIFENGAVRMPKDWADVYNQWCEAGWCGMPGPGDFGGQELPVTVLTAVGEMWQAASMAFALNPMLTQGAVETIARFATDDLKQRYLPKMNEGAWSGTMQLTEPHAGSDLSTLKTMAEPQDDGSYLLSGTKIFITFGEHDLVENIVHMVLARTPDAPAGTRGISLFLVPKFLVNSDGSLGERNDIHCISIEHKLGIHASPTCVMQMGDNGGARGWLVGELNRGLHAMFTMMNRARLAVGVEGAAIAERAYQQALSYAQERKQGHDAHGHQVAIIAHPDVKRMLLSMRAKTAAARAICFMTARMIDIAERSEDENDRGAGDAMASLLTPVAKAFCTDIGVEVASDGVQVHGGMGYIEETGAAQHFRDARIAPIYEGTNGIQAIDLVTRKLPLEDGAVVAQHIADLRAILGEVQASNLPEFGNMGARLSEAVDALENATGWILDTLTKDAEAALAGATPYMRLFGLASGGTWLAKGALAQSRSNGRAPDRIATARFFAEMLSVEAPGLATAIMEGSSWVESDLSDTSAG
ncbi:MAG: acyl-CoA dehydrogenase [Pseudomonadota bacterium]